MMIDIKDKNMVEEILKLILDNDLENDVIIDSDIQEVCVKAKKLNPKIHAYLGGVAKLNYKREIQKAKKIGAEMIKIKDTLVNKRLIDETHKNEIGVYVWGAEELHKIKKMLSYVLMQ